MAPPTVGGASPRQVVLRYMREPTQEVTGSKSAQTFLHGLCSSSCLQVSTMSPALPWMRDNKLEDEIKPFFSQLLLAMVVIIVTGTLTVTMSKRMSLGHTLRR